MKASELRIGNFTTLGVVYLIDQDVFRVVDNEGDSFKNTWANIKPIPLTEEWLLNFGFTKQDYTMSGCSIYKLGNIIIMNSFLNPVREYMGITIEGISPPTWSLKDLNFVHQLQNLYYALTGEELTIKNK